MLAEWCQVARQDGHPALVKFAELLERHQYGIISPCKHQIHPRKLEGVNNKIKIIKRIAYDFHDLEYFALKVKQALPGQPRQGQGSVGRVGEEVGDVASVCGGKSAGRPG